MEPDIAKVLSYEIKKELADRYFGFRKLIEEDKNTLDQKARLYTHTIEQQICLDLARIYILLQDKELIQEFLHLTGLEEEIFYDPYLIESPTIRKRVFFGITGRGWTKAGRFRHLLLDGYETLVRHVEDYRQKFTELIEDQEMIKEEIKLFYQKNDLGNIMGFLRSLDDHSDIQRNIGGPPPSGYGEVLEDKLRVQPPNPIEQQLPFIPPLLPLRHIRKQLKSLAKRAYKLHKEKFQLTEEP